MQMKEACIWPTLWLSHHAHNPLPSTLLTAKQVDLWNWKSRQMALLVPGIVSGASLHLACFKDEFSWGCKFKDNVCLVMDVWNNLCKKLNHSSALVTLYCHHICKHKVYHSYMRPVTFMPLLFNSLTVVWTAMTIFHNTTTRKNFFIRACWCIFKRCKLPAM